MPCKSISYAVIKKKLQIYLLICCKCYYICNIKTNKTMTTQDLKDNRNEIINFINDRGYDLKFAMELAVELAGNCDNVQELCDELKQHCKQVKSSKLSDMMANAHQDERFNSFTKQWEKI